MPPILIDRASASCSTVRHARLVFPYERNLFESIGARPSAANRRRACRPAPVRHGPTELHDVGGADTRVESRRAGQRFVRYTASLLTEAFRTALIAFLALAAGFTWQAIKTRSFPSRHPNGSSPNCASRKSPRCCCRSSAEPTSASRRRQRGATGVGADIAIAVGFFLIAATTLVRDPRQALTILALAFAAHAVVDVAHRPGLLPDGIAPRWYSIGCAVFDVYIGALCYCPILRR